MTILILLPKVYSVGKVLVLARWIQKKPWNIGNKGYMRYIDAGASQASQRRDNQTAGKVPNTNFEITLKLLCDLK
jgi:hypothetical protein